MPALRLPRWSANPELMGLEARGEAEGAGQDEDKKEDAPSLYEAVAISVEVATDVGERNFYIHQSILDTMKYFVVLQARGAGKKETMKVRLPDGARFQHFTCVLDHLARPSQRVHFDSVSDGVLVNEIAARLCTQPGAQPGTQPGTQPGADGGDGRRPGPAKRRKKDSPA